MFRLRPKAALCANPVRYFMEIVRGIFPKGVGFEILWPKMLALLLPGGSILPASALRFRKKLDGLRIAD